ncbi:uncharacterized protein BX664DRAFT_326922 [Halteromyces radiatus]|uniref:uncharacterized protein n=1 Tax=Halteromyces radiatus TaxID=101107 RepID=UPI0022201D9A|nr:uncharacterized protein BX664DRAFT_326922 [Halteromyces radiatus]KAI8097647.1 hypothetical protein BX664DRAFT_326922 [Halteromyces radiatus]
MNFNSFDLDSNKEAMGQQGYNNETNDNFDQDNSDFFAFIDPTNFHSTTGTDVQPHSSSMESHANQDPQSSSYGLPKSSASNTQTSIGNHHYNIMSPMHINVHEYQTPLQQPTSTDYNEDEEFFTPLISPAIPPNYYTNLRSDTNFSPLTSPALGPQQHVSQHQQVNNYYANSIMNTHSIQDGQSSEELEERLAMIERQQQQLRSHMQHTSGPSSSSSSTSPSPTTVTTSQSSSSPTIHHHPYSNTSSTNSTSSISKPKQSLRHKIAMSSPQFNPTTHLRSPGMHPVQSNQSSYHTFHQTTASGSVPGYHNSQNLAPATPSLLMKLGNGMHNDNNTSPGMVSPHESIVDNMMVLPDAMLPPSVEPATSKKKTVKKTTTIQASSTSTKKRRISYPRSAFTPPALLPSTSSHHRHSSGFDQGIAALVSPAALRPHTPGVMSSPSSSSIISPNNTTSSPRALKPLISPSLQPNGQRLSTIDEHEAATILASKSNYQTLREGKAKSLGIDFNTNIQSGMENRRSAHKAAEQRRRDTLKQNFDALRAELLEALLAEDELQRMENDEKEEEEDVKTARLEREKRVKQMSKVVLLQHSYEYMLRLKNDNQQKDTKLAKMTLEIQSLRMQLGMPPVTDEERQAEAEEKRLEKEKRTARLKRLEDMVDS